MNCESVTRADGLFEELAGSVDCIPRGEYCYTLLGVEHRFDGLPVIKTKPCPYFAFISGEAGAYCAFTGAKGDVLLADSCKVCGQNET